MEFSWELTRTISIRFSTSDEKQKEKSIEIYLWTLINTIVASHQFIWVVAQTRSISWLAIFS